MTVVEVPCTGCGTRAPVEGESIDEDLHAAGWSISHGQTYCPVCAAARGLSTAAIASEGRDAGRPEPPYNVRTFRAAGGMDYEDSQLQAAPADGPALGPSQRPLGTVRSAVGVPDARRAIRGHLEFLPAVHREPWDEERRVIGGFVLSSRVYAYPWWGRGVWRNPYSYHLRGRLRRDADGGCEFRWRIYNGSFLEWSLWAVMSAVFLLMAIAALITFVAQGTTSALPFGLGGIVAAAAFIAWPRLIRDRWKTLEVRLLTSWIDTISAELQGRQS